MWKAEMCLSSSNRCSRLVWFALGSGEYLWNPSEFHFQSSISCFPELIWKAVCSHMLWVVMFYLLCSRMFRQVCGIPQGSVVSSLLCNLCYAHMENSLLSHITEKGGYTVYQLISPLFSSSLSHSLSLSLPPAFFLPCPHTSLLQHFSLL